MDFMIEEGPVQMPDSGGRGLCGGRAAKLPGEAFVPAPFAEDHPKRGGA